jgi:hypothetical protein
MAMNRGWIINPSPRLDAVVETERDQLDALSERLSGWLHTYADTKSAPATCEGVRITARGWESSVALPTVDFELL